MRGGGRGAAGKRGACAVGGLAEASKERGEAKRVMQSFIMQMQVYLAKQQARHDD